MESLFSGYFPELIYNTQCIHTAKWKWENSLISGGKLRNLTWEILTESWHYMPGMAQHTFVIFIWHASYLTE